MCANDKSVIDILQLLIEGCKTQSVLCSDGVKLYKCNYLLNQIIRQIEIPTEGCYVSEAAKELWERMTNDDIFNYTYTDKVIISKPNFSEPVDFFKGGEKNPCVCKDLHTGDSFAFREIFHDEHIIPINVIIKQLLNIDPTHENIKSVIGKIGVCKMLKTEDRRIPERVKRPFDIEFVINKIYKKCGINVISKSAYEEERMIDYEKCPKCETNFMKKGEACCDLCKQQMSKKEIIGNGAKRKPARTNTNTHFIIKNKLLIRGYALYDVQNGQERLLGEILSDWQKNKLSYLQACMHFTSCSFDEYGEWHLVRINGERVMFEKIESKIKDQKQIEIDIDTW